MRILLTTRNIFDRLYLGREGFYEGSPPEIALAMKRTTVLGEKSSLDQYIKFHRDRLRRLHGVDFPLDDSAAAFIDALIALGVAVRWQYDAPEGEDKDE